jgi:serine/threonine protein phosphatase PrpC
MGNTYAVDNVTQERWNDAKSGIAGGTASVIGKRSNMEDGIRVWRHESPDVNTNAVHKDGTVITTHVTVCDGHSGNDVAIRLAHLMPLHIRGPQTNDSTKRAFSDIDLALSSVTPKLRAGSTAAIASITRAARDSPTSIKDLSTTIDVSQTKRINGVDKDGAEEVVIAKGEGKSIIPERTLLPQDAKRRETDEAGDTEEEDGDDEKEEEEENTKKPPLHRSSRCRRGVSNRVNRSSSDGGGRGRGRKRKASSKKNSKKSKHVIKKGRVSNTKREERQQERQRKQKVEEEDEKTRVENSIEERVAKQTRVEMCEPSSSCDEDSITISNGYRMTVGWIGDTRYIVLGSKGELLYVTSDHQPEDEHEKARIHATGARLDYAHGGGARVHTYNVARMFGDFDTRKDAIKLQLPPQLQAISCAPDIAHIWVPAGGLALMACDGLFETLDTLQVVEALRPLMLAGRSPETMARFLVRLALASGSGDNISVVIIRLQGFCLFVHSSSLAHISVCVCVCV